MQFYEPMSILPVSMLASMMPKRRLKREGEEGGEGGDPRDSILVHVVLAIEAVHIPDVERDQAHIHQHRALVTHPEAQLEAAETDPIEVISEKDRGAKRHQDPNRQKDCQNTKVRPPVGTTILGGSDMGTMPLLSRPGCVNGQFAGKA